MLLDLKNKNKLPEANQHECERLMFTDASLLYFIRWQNKENELKTMQQERNKMKDEIDQLETEKGELEAKVARFHHMETVLMDNSRTVAEHSRKVQQNLDEMTNVYGQICSKHEEELAKIKEEAELEKESLIQDLERVMKAKAVERNVIVELQNKIRKLEIEDHSTPYGKDIRQSTPFVKHENRQLENIDVSPINPMVPGIQRQVHFDHDQMTQQRQQQMMANQHQGQPMVMHTPQPTNNQPPGFSGQTGFTGFHGQQQNFNPPAPFQQHQQPNQYNASGASGQMMQQDSSVQFLRAINRPKPKKFTGKKGGTTFEDFMTLFSQAFGNLPDEAKLANLRDHLEEEPLSIVNGIPLEGKYVEANGRHISGFTKAVQLLREEYDRKDIQVQEYMDKLQATPTVVDRSQLKTFYHLLNQYQFAVGRPEETHFHDPNKLLKDLVKKKLSEDITWKLHAFSSVALHEMSMVAILDTIKKVLEVWPTAATATTASKTPQVTQTSSLAATSSTVQKASKPTTFSNSKFNKTKWPCIFCDAEDHSSLYCENVTDPKQREKIVVEKQRCTCCFGANHTSKTCPNYIKGVRGKCCKFCDGRHHAALHLAYFKEPAKPQSNKSGKGKVKSE